MFDYKSKIKLIKELDWKLIIIVTCIFAFGLVILSSATHATTTGSYKQIMKQGMAFLIGMGLVVVILLFDYNFLGKYYKALYIVSIILLLLVWIPGLGKVNAGARSWIHFGPLDFQTSELVKLTFILSYAKIVEEKKGKLNTIKDLVPLGLYAAPIVLLILIQPDLGTTIVFCCIIAGMLYIAGLNKKIIKTALIIIVVATPLMYMMMADHQRVRIDAFLHPDNLELPGNYQVMQSRIAIGSGGVTGKGLYQGTQNQNDFLPVQDSDFIFAVVGEELGLIGMFVLMVLYALFLIRIISIAKEAKDFYGTLIVVGVAGMFGYQIIQNIGMTVAMIPVTGVTLPFVSYGASSFITSLANLGLVLNVGMRRKKINF